MQTIYEISCKVYKLAVTYNIFVIFPMYISWHVRRHINVNLRINLILRNEKRTCRDVLIVRIILPEVEFRFFLWMIDERAEQPQMSSMTFPFDLLRIISMNFLRSFRALRLSWSITQVFHLEFSHYENLS